MSNDNVSLGLVHEAEVMLRKYGADRDFWKKISQNENVARKIVNSAVNTPLTYDVVIDYERPFDEVARTSGWERFIGEKGKDRHFTFDGRKKGGQKGKKTLQIAIFSFRYRAKKEMPSGAKGVIDELNKLSYRPANILELLVLREQYPDLSKERSIVALGAECNCGDPIQVYLTLSGGEVTQTEWDDPEWWLNNEDEKRLGSKCSLTFAAIRK